MAIKIAKCRNNKILFIRRVNVVEFCKNNSCNEKFCLENKIKKRETKRITLLLLDKR